MPWLVHFHPDFAPEVRVLSGPVQRELAALVAVLKLFGPHMRRPGSDTLAGSRHANMKELRFDADGGVWRVA